MDILIKLHEAIKYHQKVMNISTELLEASKYWQKPINIPISYWKH